MLLLEFAGNGILVTEDKVHLYYDARLDIRPRTPPHAVKTHLGTRARQVRAEHDCPRSLVGELLAARLEAVLKQLDVATAAVAALLVLDLVLHDKRLVRERQ